MNNQIELKVVYDKDYDFYDIDGICRNTSIFWALTPDEVNKFAFLYKVYASVDYKWE